MPNLSAILVTCQITDGTSVTSFPLGAVIQPKGICLPFAGQALQVSAEAFTSDPCSLPRRQAVVPAARSLLAAVTRLLVLADMVDVAYLLQHLTAVSNAPLTSGSCWPLVCLLGALSAWETPSVLEPCRSHALNTWATGASVDSR